MKNKLVIPIIFLFPIIMITTACQPTPTQAPVIRKDEDYLFQTWNENKSDDGLIYIDEQTFPKRWDDKFQFSDKLEAIATADITVPEIESCPIYRIRQDELGDETLNKLVNYFASDAIGIRSSTMTKQQITQLIVEAKLGIWNKERQTYEPWEGQEEYVSELEQALAEAPDESETEAISSEVQYTFPLSKTFTLNDSTELAINAGKYYFQMTKDIMGTAQLENWIRDEGFGRNKGERYDNVGYTIPVNISRQEAKKIADEALSTLGIENMDVAFSDRAHILDSTGERQTWLGWYFTYLRSEGGYVLQDTKWSASYPLNTEVAYRMPWPYERIDIFVNEDGINSFYWGNPTSITETITENTKILPFENVLSIAKDQIKNATVFFDESYSPIYIYDVVLSSCLRPVKDEFQEAIRIPTWFFYYHYKDYYENPYNDVAPQIVAINAVDGTLVDPVNVG